jgi:predicted small secreted protein
MMKRIVGVVLIMAMFSLTGCFTNQHMIGSGAQGTTKTVQRQWYVLWGLVPINQVDTNAMAAGAQNYDVQTQFTFVDMVIGVFTGLVTIQPRSVTVTK